MPNLEGADWEKKFYMVAENFVNPPHIIFSSDRCKAKSCLLCSIRDCPKNDPKHYSGLQCPSCNEYNGVKEQ